MLDGAEGAAPICALVSAEEFRSAFPLSSWMARFAMPRQMDAAKAVAITVIHMTKPPFNQLGGCPRILQRRAPAPHAFALSAYGLISEACWLSGAEAFRRPPSYEPHSCFQEDGNLELQFFA